MNLQALRAFSAVMKTGSYAEAAQELHCSQPTVTFQIHRLEQYLGIQLFEKIGRENVPTEQAKSLLPIVVGLMDHLSQIDRFRDVRKELEGELHIGICDGVLSYRLPHLLKDFNFRAPNVNVITHCDTAANLKTKISSGLLDLAVSFNTGTYPASLSTHPLRSMKLSLIVPAQVKIPAKAFMLPNQKIEHPFLVGNLESGPTKFFNRFMQKFNIRSKGVIQLHGVESVKAFLLNNFGFSYSLEHNFANEIQSGLLKVMPTALGDIRLGLIIMKNRNKAETPAASLLSRLIIQELSDQEEEMKDFYVRTLLKNQVQF